jgi:hypothetical protein
VLHDYRFCPYTHEPSVHRFAGDWAASINVRTEAWYLAWPYSCTAHRNGWRIDCLAVCHEPSRSFEVSMVSTSAVLSRGERLVDPCSKASLTCRRRTEWQDIDNTIFTDQRNAFRQQTVPLFPDNLIKNVGNEECYLFVCLFARLQGNLMCCCRRAKNKYSSSSCRPLSFQFDGGLTSLQLIWLVRLLFLKRP